MSNVIILACPHRPPVQCQAQYIHYIEAWRACSAHVMCIWGVPRQVRTVLSNKPVNLQRTAFRGAVKGDPDLDRAPDLDHNCVHAIPPASLTERA